ncbi:DUF3631 domain-containing protein [Nakamurella sp. A5-74]|uniref:DUF3631 domain-containing protein n=1 Tax=Nakamurella sp. A5-74 TaxID=3158264 RepID=A0AAU8DJG0_9ACTN
MSEYDEAFTEQRPADLPGAVLLQQVRDWLARFIVTVSDADHDLLALWAVHTWVAEETYTTPRLQLDSPMPGSGKTTTLEHLRRLCKHPVQMAAISSSALLARLLENGVRTLLIDEADRTLSKDNPLTGDVLAILNSGYKRGASRPVLVPVKGGWEAQEMPTYAPVAIAGNNPDLPDDTRSRIVRVLLLPDLDGNAEDSDWELIEDQAIELAIAVEEWADSIRADLATCRPALPAGIVGRFREKWSPLRRVAELAGGRWPASVDRMAVHDRDQWDQDKEDGMIREKPAVLLLKHLADVWSNGETFVPTVDLLVRLEHAHPAAWGADGPFGKPITAQRMGRMLVSSYKVNSSRESKDGPRGYMFGSLAPVWSRMQIRPPEVTGPSGATGATGTELAPVPPVAPLPPVPGVPPTQPVLEPVLEPAPTYIDAITCPLCHQPSGMALIGSVRGPACRRCLPGVRAGTTCQDCGHPREVVRDGRCNPCHGKAMRGDAA